MPEPLSVRIKTLDDAIKEIESGAQAVTLDGIQFTRATLFRLHMRRDKLQKQMDRANGARPMIKSVSLNSLGYS